MHIMIIGSHGTNISLDNSSKMGQWNYLPKIGSLSNTNKIFYNLWETFKNK